MHIGAIIAPNDTQVANSDDIVTQQVDACITIKLLSTWFATIVFVVT